MNELSVSFRPHIYYEVRNLAYLASFTVILKERKERRSGRKRRGEGGKRTARALWPTSMFWCYLNKGALRKSFTHGQDEIVKYLRHYVIKDSPSTLASCLPQHSEVSLRIYVYDVTVGRGRETYTRNIRGYLLIYRSPQASVKTLHPSSPLYNHSLKWESPRRVACDLQNFPERKESRLTDLQTFYSFYFPFIFFISYSRPFVILSVFNFFLSSILYLTSLFSRLVF